MMRMSVYGEMNDQVRDVVISMIDQEREGEEIDQALVKNVLDIYTEMGEGSMKYYQKDFEEAMLVDTATFYSQKASIWITSESYKDYMLKVVEHELLFVFASKLEEKKQLDSEAA
ncbi:Cullin-1 [Camellia lanceoleosa]|uniref:Cullin-1 n=1 Tax=Camellia lanceoleosa TaxID=1840588 RepID=A0ACC0HCA2_9ERIC|nr:Cullin-1 [Camellia lanceoleosa]